jgi:hypothetical protein
LISAFWGPYRYFYAMHSDLSLSIEVFPLAVSGTSLNNDNHVLIGKRKEVTEYLDRFELVPAGGLDEKHSTPDSVDYIKQLIDEFEEETQLDRSCITSTKTLGIIFDLKHNVFDICCLIRVNCSNIPLASSNEYDALEWVDSNNSKLSSATPTSRVLLNLLSDSR